MIVMTKKLSKGELYLVSLYSDLKHLLSILVNKKLKDHNLSQMNRAVYTLETVTSSKSFFVSHVQWTSIEKVRVLNS